jgi:hypothetical protein
VALVGLVAGCGGGESKDRSTASKTQPTTKALNGKDLETQVRAVLERRRPEYTVTVSCPARTPIQKGRESRCVVDVHGGNPSGKLFVIVTQLANGQVQPELYPIPKA